MTGITILLGYSLYLYYYLTHKLHPFIVHCLIYAKVSQGFNDGGLWINSFSLLTTADAFLLNNLDISNNFLLKMKLKLLILMYRILYFSTSLDYY